MTDLALIRDDGSVVRTHIAPQGWLEIPGAQMQVSPPQAGWQGAGHKIVPFHRFEVPDGKIAIGEPSYAVDEDGVHESYAVEDAPVFAPEISDRQFAHALWKQGTISYAEAMGFVQTGTIPPAMSALIDAMPEAIRDDARLLVAGAQTFDFNHPVSQQLMASFGWTAEEARDFWLFAGSL